MKQETILTSNIRPASLAWTLFSITLLALLDGASESFKVDEAYIELFKVIISAQIAFYYTSRGIEKVKRKDE